MVINRFEILVDMLRAEAPIASGGFFALVRENESLSVKFESGETGYLYPALLDYLTTVFSAGMIDTLVNRVNACVMHEEFAYASSLEPYEEAALWDTWEQIDARSAYDDKLALYRQY